MSDMNSSSPFSDPMQPSASEIIRVYGDEAFNVAQKQISACNARGDFSAAEVWVVICRQIRETQQSAEGMPAE